MDPDAQETIDILLDTQAALEIVKLLEKNELILNTLYSKFASKYPDNADFWKRIANDESNHAKWVSELNGQVNSGNVTFNKYRFDKKNLEDFHAHVLDLIDKVENPSFSEFEAAVLSDELESNMIERSFFRVFEADSELLRITFEKLEASTEVHFQQIKNLIQRLTKKKS